MRERAPRGASKPRSTPMLNQIIPSRELAMPVTPFDATPPCEAPRGPLRRTDRGHGLRARTGNWRGPARLATMLLAFLLGAIAHAADPRAGAALLLVAGPDLVDPNFHQTVVLVTRSAGFAGPVGVILNRPMPLTLAGALPDIKGLADSGDKLFFGGPVARQALLYAFRSDKPPEDAVEVAPGIYLGSSGEHLRELLARPKPVEGLRVFAGHAGWAPGQLESEVARGFWKSARVDASSIFTEKPETLWPELNRRAALTTVRSPGLVAPLAVALRVAQAVAFDAVGRPEHGQCHDERLDQPALAARHPREGADRHHDRQRPRRQLLGVEQELDLLPAMRARAHVVLALDLGPADELALEGLLAVRAFAPHRIGQPQASNALPNGVTRVFLMPPAWSGSVSP